MAEENVPTGEIDANQIVHRNENVANENTSDNLLLTLDSSHQHIHSNLFCD